MSVDDVEDDPSQDPDDAGRIDPKLDGLVRGAAWVLSEVIWSPPGWRVLQMRIQLRALGRHGNAALPKVKRYIADAERLVV
jgi:hypothetical protein